MRPRKSKFQVLVLCPCDDRAEIRKDGRLVALQERLDEAAAAAKATTTALREMAVEAPKCRDPVRRNQLRKRARKSPQRV